MGVDGLWLRLLSRSEDLTDEVCRRSRHMLPLVARLCLTATFFEDALRMWLQFFEQLAYLQVHFNCSEMLSVLIVLVNLLGQVVGSVLILVRLWVNVAVILLASLVLLQVHMHMVPLQLQLLLRNFALLGGLLLLHVETQERAAAARICTTTAGVPLLINRRPQHLMRLTGRVLLACMYLTLLRQEIEVPALTLNSLGVVLMLMIVLGYRTRVAALLLAIILTVLNLYTNAWWFVEDSNSDLVKYNYFHSLSVVGGLLLVVVLGPGQVSLEQYKKQW
ncbi:GH22787 [Drosophila grimshawi]|uniref:GH22787 n=1 Tax=Drosophila grimshawi TaxID=7222 RepID=B4JSQ5_DROGR|nr:GH22787 [Drosophila grimshawi]